jgi:transmembrane sensor
LNRQILDEASSWFVDFRVGDIDQDAPERFDRWLRQSPEHIRAYIEIARTYVVLPSIFPDRKIDVRQLIAFARSDGNVVPMTPKGRSAEPDNHASSIVPPSDGSRHRLGLLAAAIAVISVAASLLTWIVTQRDTTYSTEIGERRSITLADGSNIDLNARSTLRISLSGTERNVELIEGQALFVVAKDQSRPFIVRSDGVVVRAVGTQFDVNRKKGGTTVTVVEGRVAVLRERAGQPVIAGPADGDSPAAKSTILSAGEQVTVTARAMTAPKRADIAAATAWMQRRLIFDGSRLSDVVDDFNRYNRRQLVIDDRALDDIHISGVYSSTDPSSLIRFLREQPGVQVIETDETVRIARP